MKVGNDFIIHNFDKAVYNIRKLRGELNPMEHKTEGVFTRFAKGAKAFTFNIGLKDYVLVKPEEGDSQIKITIEELAAILGIGPDNVDNLTKDLKGVGGPQISEKMAHQLEEKLNQPPVVDAKTPRWDEMRQNLAATNKSEINKMPIAELKETLNTLEYHWDEIKKNKDDVGKYGQWDEERQVLHLRRGIDRIERGRTWTLPRSVEIHFNQEPAQIYVLNKGSKHPERKKKLREKTKKLGKGGFKQVARSVNLNNLKEHVHATINIEKKSQKFKMAAEQLKEYSIREVQLQSLFSQDPEFVKIAGWSEYKKKNSKDTKIAITLEFCNSGELFKAATDRTTNAGKRINENVNDLMQVVTDLLNMLVKLEQKGVINRDIKLENIFLQANDNSPLRAKMSDFGLAWTQEDAKKQKETCGSPQYVAPEYIDESNPEEIRAGFSTNTWEMGIVLSTLLTGVVVYGNEDPLQVGGITQSTLDRNIQYLLLDTETRLPECIKNNRDLRRFLKQLVNDMLQVNPLQRPTATELLARLEDFKSTHNMV